MQASDGLLRILECEVGHLIILPILFTGIGGARSVPPFLGNGLDNAAVPEVVRPRVMDGAVRIRTCPLLPTNGTRVSPRLTRGRLRRSDQLGGSLALLLFLPSRGRTCLGVRGLGFLDVRATRLPLTGFSCSRTFVCEGKELRGRGDHPCGQLLRHLAVPHASPKGYADRLAGDLGDRVPALAEALDVFAEGLSLALLHLVEVILLSRSSRRALEVGDKLVAQVFPRADRGFREVHQPRPGGTGQGCGKVVGHDLRSSSSSLHHGGVDLEKLVWVVRAIILLNGCGPELLRPTHASKVICESLTASAVTSGAQGSVSLRAPTDRGPTTWAPGCRAGVRLVLERLLFPAQLPPPLEGGAEVFTALAARQRLLFLPSTPAATPGAGGLRLGSRVNRPPAGPGSPSLSLRVTKRRMGRTCRTVPDSSSGRCPTRRA